MNEFTRFKNELWFLDFAYVDKLAELNTGVEYVLFRQGLFVRTLEAKGMKSKYSKETVRAFFIKLKKTKSTLKNLG